MVLGTVASNMNANRWILMNRDCDLGLGLLGLVLNSSQCQLLMDCLLFSPAVTALGTMLTVMTAHGDKTSS